MTPRSPSGIGNELAADSPSGCSGATETTAAWALRAFADGVTSQIRSVDPNHLVSLGTIGTGQCGLQGSDYEYVHAGHVELCDYHDYYDATQAMPDDGYNRLAQRIAQCDQLGMPLVVSESGIVADVGAQGQSTGTIDADTLRQRADFFQAKLGAAFGAGVAGYLIWEKLQYASNSAYDLDNGRYDVGPDALEPDPTNAVLAGEAAVFGATPVAPLVRSSFEDGDVDGWEGHSGAAVSNSTDVAWGGSHSLRVDLAPSPALDRIRTANTAGLAPGSTVEWHVNLPSGSPDHPSVYPYVRAVGGQLTETPSTRLEPGWNTVTWTVPSAAPAPFGQAGLGVRGVTAPGTIYVDDPAW
jgi:hypothetical protein